MPAVNAIKVDASLPLVDAALTEPLGCVVHSCDYVGRFESRYRIRDANVSHRVRTILIFGGGPAGLLFTQYLRAGLGFDGLIIVSDPNPLKRQLAADVGATAFDPLSGDLREAVLELTEAVAPNTSSTPRALARSFDMPVCCANRERSSSTDMAIPASI